MNNISFNGIQNIKIYKKTQENPCSLYLSRDFRIKPERKEILDIMFSAKLTDDDEGHDLADFKNRLTNSRIFNPENSDTVVLHAVQTRIPENNTESAQFYLNNEPLIINNDKILPILTFFARITRNAAQNDLFSCSKREYLMIINRLIHKTASEYIKMS